MSVPVALKPFFSIVLLLQLQEFCELRVAAFNLLSSSKAVVGQIVRASAPGGHVDEPLESARRMLEPFRCVNCVEVEDGACIRLFCPGQEALIIAPDNAHSAVDQIDPIRAEILSHLIEEALQHRSGDIDLSDDLTRRMSSVKLLVNFLMIVVGIDAQLM